MKILLSGSSGLIGSALLSYLKARGHEVVRLVRTFQSSQEKNILWNPARAEMNREDFEGYDVIINLGGENISSGRWTAEKKERIRESRVVGSRLLAGLFTQLDRPPKLFINSSAIGYYGDRGREILTEQSLPGKGFLASLCQEWEEAAAPAADSGIRLVFLRTGMVLSGNGGAFKMMLPLFKWGLGGKIGSGKQFVSWILLEDLVGAIHHLMEHPEVAGPVNCVSPEPVTNEELTKTLGRLLHRPTIFPLPAPMARLLFGEMADELLLSSTRVFPKILEKTGYCFQYPRIEQALTRLLI